MYWSADCTGLGTARARGRIRYARVSTRDQNLEMQLDALAKAACMRIFTDKLSGAQVERPGRKEALSHLREADTLVVWKLDRLGRSVKGLVDLVNELEARKVHFQSVTDGIDTRTPHGRFFFHVTAKFNYTWMSVDLVIIKIDGAAKRPPGRRA
jgi:DNA invertase Pin-like site-specific DNA recombinase